MKSSLRPRIDFATAHGGLQKKDRAISNRESAQDDTVNGFLIFKTASEKCARFCQLAIFEGCLCVLLCDFYYLPHLMKLGCAYNYDGFSIYT